ncbi:MAG: tripartite tricarboxylate transporter substrate binding protein [Burkholderiales bacterium]
MTILFRIGAAMMFAAFATGAFGQTPGWPVKPIRLVVPFPPGGTTDQLARMLSPGLMQALGQQIIVENRAGGGGTIGTGQVAKSAPDGYTWVAVFDTHAINPSIIPNMPFDTRNDLAPVMLVATGTMVITAHKSQPYKTLGELLAAARSKPNAVAFGTIGTGSLAHLAITLMGAQVSFQMQHVPYKGGGPLAQDAIAGHVPIAMATTALLSPHIKAGNLTALAVSSIKRDPDLRGVPTVAESGIPGFEAQAWWGIFAPAKTPAPIIQRMFDEVTKVLSEKTIHERLTAQGFNLVGRPPEQLAKFLDDEMAKWSKVVKDFGIRAGD